MRNKSYCSRQEPPQRTISYCRRVLLILCAVLCVFAPVPRAVAGDAPPWMHALVNAPLPAHDEKTDAMLLYLEKSVMVQSADKIKTTVRRAYKILRPNGREYGYAGASYHPHSKISGFHGWCIPAQGKDYEVKEKDAVEVALPAIDGADLVNDVRYKALLIPASDPGNIVGYEYVLEEQPLFFEDSWDFQVTIPVREARFFLQLPPDWGYKASWLNFAETKPVQTGPGQWQWVLNDVKAIRPEDDMPPFVGVAGKMIVSFLPPGGATSKAYSTWKEMGDWYLNLTSGRRDASPEIRQKVSVQTAGAGILLEKMKALAKFMQSDIRYVAITLGIGGWQPHFAAEVFAHRYGDCKDKATLLSSMLHEIGVESYYVIINTERGSVTPQTPAHNAFDHMVLAVKIPDGANDPSFIATIQHPKLGKLLFFDPTNPLIPFGQIGGYLQANYGLLVTPLGGELVELPTQPSEMNGVRRTAKLTLDADGALQGNVNEVRAGDQAWVQREYLRSVTKDTDQIKPVEQLLSQSLPIFHIIKATVINLKQTDRPFGFEYSFMAENYAKNAGNLLLVRPRVIGRQSSSLLETKEPRKFPVEFSGPSRDSDTFEITLPAGYEVDDLPPPVDVDYSFASYHSKTEVQGNVLCYSRTMEIKELSVPVNKIGDLKKFYRIIAGDERNTAILKPSGKS